LDTEVLDTLAYCLGLVAYPLIVLLSTLKSAELIAQCDGIVLDLATAHNSTKLISRCCEMLTLLLNLCKAGGKLFQFADQLLSILV
jgi:hypothetical protein